MVMKISTQQVPNISQLFLLLLFLSSIDYNGKNTIRFYNLELSYFFKVFVVLGLFPQGFISNKSLKMYMACQFQIQQELGIVVETTSLWAVLGTFAISIFVTDMCAKITFVTFSPHN